MKKKNIKISKIIFLFSIFYFLFSEVGYSQPITWYRTWGLPGVQRSESGKRVCQTFDGGYAVLTQVGNSYITWFDLLKYDYLGNLQWVKVIVDSTDRTLMDMQQTSDSGFIFAGWTYGALLVRTDKFGNLKWQRNYTNLNPGTEFYSVKQTSDTGFIACGGYTDYINPSSKAILIKVDSLGYVKWERQYMDSLMNGFADIIQDSNKNFYIAGQTFSIVTRTYALIKKFDSFGNVIWTNIFYTNGGVQNIVQLLDGSLVVAGSDDNSNHKPIAGKFDTSGHTIWVRSYNPTLTVNLFFYYMSRDLSGNIIFTGLFSKLGYYTTIGIWKLDTSGNIINVKNIEQLGYTLIGAECINSTIDYGFIITGGVDLNSNQDALIVKIDSCFNAPVITSLKNVSYNFPNEFIIHQNYPNPFNYTTLIKYSLPNNGIVIINIYNLLGKKVFSDKEYKYAGVNEKIFDFEKFNLSSGVYFIKIDFETQSKSIKLLYLK